MFKRKIETTINEYLDSDKETILIIEGARQIGKTYIINKLAKAKFKNYIEINLKDDYAKFCDLVQFIKANNHEFCDL